MASKQHLILASAFRGDFENLTTEQITIIKQAMVQFAAEEVVRFKNREIEGEMKSFIKLMFNFTWDNAILYARYQVFKKAKKQAQLKANTENRKVYVIRKSATGFKLLSTLDVEHNKRIRILDKHVDSKTLHTLSDFVAYPKK